MNGIKVTAKLIISIVIINLLCMFYFELTYNQIMYNDYKDMYNEFLIMENRVDKLIEVNIKLQKYIINKEVRNE